jgi:hypothetical protein
MRRPILFAAGLLLAGSALPGSTGEAASEAPAAGASAATPATTPAAPTAVVLRAEGLRPDAAARVGSFLEPGERLVPPEAGRVVLLLHDGEALVVEEPMEVPEAAGETDRLFRLLRALLARPEEARSLEPPPAQGAADSVHEPTGVEPADAVPVRPAGGRRVRAITPELVWRAADGAAAYRVHLWNPDEDLLEWEAGADTAWVLPPESALTPGSVYAWAVTPLPGTETGPRARFQVASREILDDVARELGELRARGLDPEGDGLLPAAALFRSMALPYDALSVLEELRARGDLWSEGLRAFAGRLDAELNDPGLVPDQADPEP